jgi:hypothetical protein
MDDPEFTENEEHHFPFVSGNIRLDIIATKIGDREWSVAVINGRGIFSTWNEYFESADRAINVAIRAIREEGIEEFANVEGFEYLDENHEDG